MAVSWFVQEVILEPNQLYQTKNVPDAVAGPIPFKLVSALMAPERSLLAFLNAFLVVVATANSVLIRTKSRIRDRFFPRYNFHFVICTNSSCVT